MILKNRDWVDWLEDGVGRLMDKTGEFELVEDGK